MEAWGETKGVEFMRNLQADEIVSISGGELECSVGFPSGVKCEGGWSDWKAAIEGGWNFMASIPGTVPWMAERIFVQST